MRAEYVDNGDGDAGANATEDGGAHGVGGWSGQPRLCGSWQEAISGSGGGAGAGAAGGGGREGGKWREEYKGKAGARGVAHLSAG